MSKDPIGDRMKKQYENRTRYYLPRRTYTILRLDGKAFHTLTKNLSSPYDSNFRTCMIQAAAYLCSEAMGTRFAYVQSDEISLLLTDFASTQTEAWFDGNIQKIASVAASLTTCAFNAEDYMRSKNLRGCFDCRVFTIPDPVEVENYFIWRQRDCVRNSISMVAQSLYSHKQLQGKNTSELQEMIHEAGHNWAYYEDAFKNGSLVQRELYEGTQNAIRSRWIAPAAFTFTEHREHLTAMIK